MVITNKIFITNEIYPIEIILNISSSNNLENKIFLFATLDTNCNGGEVLNSNTIDQIDVNKNIAANTYKIYINNEGTVLSHLCNIDTRELMEKIIEKIQLTINGGLN